MRQKNTVKWDGLSCKKIATPKKQTQRLNYPQTKEFLDYPLKQGLHTNVTSEIIGESCSDLFLHYLLRTRRTEMRAHAYKSIVKQPAHGP